MTALLALVRKVFAIVARGFLLGLGFSLAVGGSYMLIWQEVIADGERQMDKLMSMQSQADKQQISALTFSELAEIEHDGATSIVGKVRNTGKDPVMAVDIQAQMFNKGRFVDKYSTRLSGTLAPGDSQYFKISCSCDGTPPAEHDSFKVIAVSSF